MTRLLLAVLLAFPAAAQDKFDELDREAGPPEEAPEDYFQAREKMARTVVEQAREQAEQVEALSAAMQKQYDKLLERLAAQREELRLKVSGKWTDFHESTNKEWVDYNAQADGLSRVDFEKGKIEVEVLIPAEEAQDPEKLKALAEKKIAAQTKKILAEKGEDKAEVLKDQVKAQDGAPVTGKTAEAFVKKELAPRIVIEEKPVVADDGKPRLKAKVKIDLVPEHLQVRAKRVEPQVLEASRKYDLDPALVFAVIHTESEFNPRAKSQAPAFGLMQLMPRSGAREAWLYLHKKEKILSPEELYDPDQNILLGATYLHLLQTRHFGKVKKADNRRTLSIAAYNCGPGCVRKNILSKGDPDALSNDQLVALVKKEAPKETQHYVPRVEGRVALYRKP